VYDGVDTVVLHNELAYHDVLPVQWQPLSRSLDPFELAGLEEANLLLLQACLAVEESPVRDKNEELHPLAGELARLDFKLNLILKLLGTLVDSKQLAEPVPVQFNAHGASWQGRGSLPAIGTTGVLHIGLRSSLLQTLDLHAEITENQGGAMSASFLNLTPATGELIQQLCFLKHRKRIAGSRKSRTA